VPGEYLRIEGVQEALAALRTYEGPEMTRRIRIATLAGARALKEPIRAATPSHQHTGSRYPSDLRASVAVRVRKDASGFLGYVVGPTGKQGWVRNFVIGGTKAHIELGKVGKPLGLPWGPRALVHHPGSRKNPYVERVGEALEGEVLMAMAKSIAQQQQRAGF
jgi:hypothetical protein